MRGRLLVLASLSFLGVLTLTAPSLTAQTSSSQKRNITEKDLFAFRWIGDTQISPDGNHAVFVQTTVNAKRDGYETSLFLLDLTQPASAPRRLTNGPHDASPRWSPDGASLAFLRAPEKEGKPQPPQLFLLPLAGGEPEQLTKLEKGVSSPQWSPSGASLVLLSETPIFPKPADKADKKDDKDAAKPDEHKSDIKIITRAVYRSNGEGYPDTTQVPQLYLLTLPKSGETAAAPIQLTSGRYGVNEATFAPGKPFLYYTSEHTDEPYYDLPHNEIYALDLTAPESKPASVLVAKLAFGASGLAISPDGAHIAFHGEDTPPKPRSHQQPDMFLLDIDATHPAPATTPARNLTEKYDYEIGGSVGGDNTAPRGAGRNLPHWAPDGKTLFDVVGKRGSALLVALDTSTGAVTELSQEKQAVQGFAIASSGQQALILVSTPLNLGDLFTLALNGSKSQSQLTHVNEALFSQLNLTLPDDLEVAPTANPKDIASQTIETWVQRPPDFDPAKKYPMILNIHGGPHSAYGWVFDHEFQFMAAKGYVVVYPNPRGSTNYGQQFANVIQHNYPGDDFHDLMDACDAVLKLGYVDPARQGVTGGSGGGLLTDWTVTQTTRFKAAVAQRDIVDWANFWYTADFTLFQPTWFEGPPFDYPEEFKKYSPITYVKNIKTPMMFILGEADYRTPPTGGGEDFFRALKYRHIDTVMVRFPGESHELSRSGQPWHRIERLENITNWFDKYLDGKPEPQYDVVPTAAAN